MNTESQTDRITQLESRLQAVEAERDEARAMLEENFKGVVAIRCTKHFRIPPYNRNEAMGGECPVCKVEELEKERDEWRKTAGERLDLLTKAEGRALELLSERDRYRAALEEISKWTKWPCGDASIAPRIADEALQPAQKDAPEKGTK